MEALIRKNADIENENFVTVVSVGTSSETPQTPLIKKSVSAFDQNNKSSAYVTVLTIGDDDEDCVNNKDVIEEVLVYRLPGERLGFGLKFEGGTKANEYVKRLFIQSCAPDSPASRVQSSWGKLSEGDEVLEIDSMAVNKMTRIDCVRCLKDSNVVIKLLVRHFFVEIQQKNDLSKTRSLEDLPQVVSAEKKRTPPPPPPVPPRKIPKKHYNKNSVTINNNKDVANNEANNNQVVNSRQINSLEVTVSVNNSKGKKFQSPRSSGRSSYSPDIPRRDRRFSDGSVGPPDAEVYVDLFSQESTQSLSESDDTGSSISTVVDRFSSFPTTTASSLAGSLPSTPTSIQKHLDFSHVLNAYEDEEFSTVLNKNLIKQTINISKNADVDRHGNKIEEKQVSSEDGVPLQPPSCFQDAPLSYGNEDMRIETKSNGIDICEYSIVQNPMNSNEKHYATSAISEEKIFKKPPVPPRSRDLINGHKVNGCKEVQNIHDENMNISNLPRLVDFVPKSKVRQNFENHVEIINTFLENEKRNTDYLNSDEIDNSNDLFENYDNDIDVFSSKWSLAPQLATIGEVEEEGNQDSLRTPLNSTPIVIVENADNENNDEAKVRPVCQSDVSKDPVPNNTKEGINGKMETFSSDSRQPPDGHEFPDYDEESMETEHKFSGRNSYADEGNVKPSETLKVFKSVECVNSSQNRSSFNDFTSVPLQNKSFLNKINSVSNSDLSLINSKDPYDSSDEVTFRRTGLEPTLHTRSQSLIDMSSISKQKGDRWSLLAEQRKKGLSKLKGLVIPEHISESETAPAVNIPEIISHTTPSFVLETKINSSHTTQYEATETEPVALPLTSPPWSSGINNNNNNITNAIPKYSPAFKRKSLQIYPTIKNNNNESNNKKEEPQLNLVNTAINKIPDKPLTSATTISRKSETEEFKLDNLSDAPKSLESITSPTRSDCSFDYITNKYNNNNKTNEVNANIRVLKESPNYISRLHKDLGKSEDESDNDSAVSSSQSSYISRCSPPPSPTRSCEMLDYDSNMRSKSDDGVQCRLLKPASVEAINRKNILASAKCRSGRDLKVGSPIIQRKYDDDDSLNASSIETDNSISNHSSSSASKQEFEFNVVESADLVRDENNTVVNCEESAATASPPKQLMVNGIEEKKQSDVIIPTVKKVETYTPLVTLKPVAQHRNVSDIKVSKTLLTDNLPRTRNILSRNQKSMSVTDLRKSFEKFGESPPPLPKNVVTTNNPKPKIEMTIKPLLELKAKRSENVAKLETAKTKPNSTQKPVEQANVTKECVSSSEANTRKVVLCPEFVGGSVGITLAGGTDYETKEITVHRIRYGSAAYNNGSLKKGDKIISINGKTTAGLTHAESVELLKEPVEKFILLVEDGKEEATSSPKRKSFIYESPEPKSSTEVVQVKNVTNVISLVKDGAGLGFSIEGGKDSLQGDLPLRVKKIFQGGAAEKDGNLLVGDELIAINEVSLINLSRIEAWSLMKKLPDGNVSIQIHR